MDLLFKRYASPFVMLDQMIAVNRFTEFVDEFIDMHNKEIENDTLWDLYLHAQGFIDKPFSEWKKQLKGEAYQEPVNLEATVGNSIEILQDFAPEG